MKITINKARLQAKIDSGFQKSLPVLSEIVLQDCNRYAKEDTGALIASSLTHSRPQDGQLVWQTPYARRQYWEIKTAYTDVNPTASWKWCEVAKRLHLGQWTRQAQILFERYM